MKELENNKTDKIDLIENNPWKKNGGKREGAGRKAKLHLKRQFNAREDLYWWIDENWDALLNGLKICLDSKDKEIIKYLIDQRIGKAPQRLEMTGDEGKPLQISIIRYGAEGNQTTSATG